MITAITTVDYAVYFTQGNAKIGRGKNHWLLFNVYFSKKEAEEKAEKLEERYGWKTKVERYCRRAEIK